MQTHYEYSSAEAVWADDEIARRVTGELRAGGQVRSVLDAGCGNGNLAARIAAEGFEVSAFDISASGVGHARAAFPDVRFEVASVYDDLAARFGQAFDACVAVEVIEHLYDPRQFVRGAFEVLRPGGWLVVTTPYHGYVKNVILALLGRMDGHYTALWDGGHIKFWSRSTLASVLVEAGFEVVRFHGTGRVPWVWKSMVVTARRPCQPT